MKKTWMEYSGIGLGYVMGIFTFAGSYLRHARLFHPRGQLYHGQCQSLRKGVSLPTFALIRLSQGIWKTQHWPDVLGFSFRLSHQEIKSVKPRSKDQDLLFASFAHVWQLPLSPFLSAFHFASNKFFAIAPFKFQGEECELRLVPEWKDSSSRNRFLEVDKAIMKGNASALIQQRVHGESEWRDLARVTIRRHSRLDGEALRFNPFQDGAGLSPQGFIQHLRIGAYGLSQLGRARSPVALEKNPGKGNALPSSLPSHSPLA